MVFGIDETIERRRGRRTGALGVYRDAVHTSESHVVKTIALRWISPMRLADMPWAHRTWALPVLVMTLFTIVAGCSDEPTETPAEVAQAIDQGPATATPLPTAVSTAPVPPQVPFPSPIARSTPRSSDPSPRRISDAPTGIEALWLVVIVVIYGALFGGGCALIASRKGLNPTPVFLIGLGLGPIGLAIVWIIPSNRGESP